MLIRIEARIESSSLEHPRRWASRRGLEAHHLLRHSPTVDSHLSTSSPASYHCPDHQSLVGRARHPPHIDQLAVFDLGCLRSFIDTRLCTASLAADRTAALLFAWRPCPACAATADDEGRGAALTEERPRQGSDSSRACYSFTGGRISTPVKAASDSPLTFYTEPRQEGTSGTVPTPAPRSPDASMTKPHVHLYGPRHCGPVPYGAA